MVPKARHTRGAMHNLKTKLWASNEGVYFPLMIGSKNKFCEETRLSWEFGFPLVLNFISLGIYLRERKVCLAWKLRF